MEQLTKNNAWQVPGIIFFTERIIASGRIAFGYLATLEPFFFLVVILCFVRAWWKYRTLCEIDMKGCTVHGGGGGKTGQGLESLRRTRFCCCIYVTLTPHSRGIRRYW